MNKKKTMSTGHTIRILNMLPTSANSQMCMGGVCASTSADSKGMFTMEMKANNGPVE